MRSFIINSILIVEEYNYLKMLVLLSGLFINMKLLIENWRKFLNEEPLNEKNHWQQLLCAGIASQWWHPVSVAGLENWVEELSKGLRLRTIRLEAG